MDLKYRGDQARLFKLCHDLKWKQSSLAEFLEISPVVLSRYWHGTRELPKPLFQKILDQITDDCLDRGMNMMGLEDRVKRLEDKLG